MEIEDIDAIEEQLQNIQNISDQIQPIEYYDSTPIAKYLIKPTVEENYPYDLPDLTIQL